MQDLESALRANEDEKKYCEMCMEETSVLFIVGPEQISVCGVCKGMEESWQKEQVQKVTTDNDGWHDLRKNPEDLPEYKDNHVVWATDGNGWLNRCVFVRPWRVSLPPHWRMHNGQDTPKIIAWLSQSKPEVPARFSSKEKV